MRILVTGGAGFIGSHLCERLLQCGADLTIVDSLDDFYPPAEKAANLDSVSRRGPISFYRADICDQTAVFKVFRRHKPEVVVHLAARAGVRPSLDQPLLYERVNVHGTLTILEACRRLTRRPKVLFGSSSCVYGAANRAPFREDDCSNMPVSPYAVTKLAGERFCFAYSRLYGIPVVCLRFFTVYGPRQRPDLAIRQFVEKIDRGERIDIFGDGSAARDHTFVDDIVNGVIAALKLDCSFEIFNLGNSRPISLNETIAAIERSLGKRARIRRLPFPPGDVLIACADLDKARRVLEYEPHIPFENGLREFVEWHRNRAVGRDGCRPQAASHACATAACR